MPIVDSFKKLKKETLDLEAKLYKVKQIRKFFASKKGDYRNNSRFNNSIYTIPTNNEIKDLIIRFRSNVLEIIAKEKKEYMIRNKVEPNNNSGNISINNVLIFKELPNNDKKSLNYLSYFEWAEESISLIGDKYEDYDWIMLNVYCPLIYINDKLFGDNDNSNFKKNAKNFFNKALKLLNESYKEPNKYIYTYLFVDKFSIRLDEAVELKNMLIDSGVLERDGCTSYDIADRLNDLINKSNIINTDNPILTIPGKEEREQ